MAAVLLLSGHWCEQETLVVVNADGGGRDSPAEDGDAPADTGHEPDAPGPAAPGPLTLVVAELEVVTERECDLDGDGFPDNSVAELGSPGSALFAVGLETIFWGGRGVDAYIGIHFAWVSDLAGPTAEDGRAAILLVRDGDVPSDSSDDFTGEETFWAGAMSLDRCGEPLAVALTSLAGGALTWTGGAVAVPLPAGGALSLSGVDFAGVVAPHGESFSGLICGYATIRSLGETPFPGTVLSMLEALTHGGAAFGVGELPGLQPDVDLDGDGFERVVVDADGRVAECIDGDGTNIVGSDCFNDPRMADGFSFTFGLSGTRGHIAGRAPGWEYTWPPCRSAPSATSFFDTITTRDGPCAGLGGLCNPRQTTPCCDAENLCSGADRAAYRCLPPCEPTFCAYGSEPGYCPAGSSDVGLCQPYLRSPEAAGCEPGASGCETEYGQTNNTSCGQSGGNAYCLERCDLEPDRCPVGFRTCIPNVLRSGGVCAFRE